MVLSLIQATADNYREQHSGYPCNIPLCEQHEAIVLQSEHAFVNTYRACTQIEDILLIRTIPPACFFCRYGPEDTDE